MEIEQLKVYLAAAEEKCFTKAAKKLYVSHSTVSRAISALESEFGVRLFIRSGHEMSLTKAGQILLEEAKKLLAAAEETARKVRDTKFQIK